MSLSLFPPLPVVSYAPCAAFSCSARSRIRWRRSAISCGTRRPTRAKTIAQSTQAMMQMTSMAFCSGMPNTKRLAIQDSAGGDVESLLDAVRKGSDQQLVRLMQQHEEKEDGDNGPTVAGRGLHRNLLCPGWTRVAEKAHQRDNLGVTVLVVQPQNCLESSSLWSGTSLRQQRLHVRMEPGVAKGLTEGEPAAPADLGSTRPHGPGDRRDRISGAPPPTGPGGRCQPAGLAAGGLRSGTAPGSHGQRWPRPLCQLSR